MKCYDCGTELDSALKYCPNCGRLNIYYVSPESDIPNEKLSEYSRKSTKKSPARTIVICAAAAIVALAAIITIISFVRSDPSSYFYNYPSESTGIAQARSSYTLLAGDGTDTATVMIS